MVMYKIETMTKCKIKKKKHFHIFQKQVQNVHDLSVTNQKNGSIYKQLASQLAVEENYIIQIKILMY